MNDNQKGLKNQDLIGCQLRLYLHKSGEVKNNNKKQVAWKLHLEETQW